MVREGWPDGVGWWWWAIREFKQIATAGADTVAGSKFTQKCDTAHVRRLHPTVARNLTT